jgi:hypothetical protein
MKIGKTKFFNIANDIFHPLRNNMVSDVINNLKVHNHAVFASDIVRQNTNTIAQYNSEIWNKKMLTKN